MPDVVMVRSVLSTNRTPLSRTYAAAGGAPVVTHVDPLIFVRRFFAACSACDFCNDHCCHLGCDMDLDNVARLAVDHAAALEAHTGTSREEWFEDTTYIDMDFKGNRFRSTRVVDGTCIFNNRGCGIHSYCLEQGLDYHDLKPTYCWLFPLTIEASALCPQNNVMDRSLVCVDQGLTLYASQRQGLLHLFGSELVAELDALGQETLAAVEALPPGKSVEEHLSSPG